jgi:prepilin-type processing-associated H-X9-DG protein
MTGVSYLRSKTRVPDILDGTTNTYLAGEKWLSPDHYYDGESHGDQYSLYHGASPDILRWVGKKSDEIWLPCPDTETPKGCDCGLLPFGSCHPGTWNVVFCDGSVHSVSFNIDAGVHRRYGCRNDGKPTGGTIE